MNRYSAFCKVVEVGSFSKAAGLLGYTQSGISQMIQSLEDELSMRLLVRSHTGVKLTPEGSELLPYIITVVNSHRTLIEKNREIKGLSSGIIRIGTFTSVSSSWLPDMIQEFQATYPNIQFSLLQGEYDAISEWIHTGEIDFGFHNIGLVKGLKTITFMTDEMVAVLPRRHPLAAQESVTIKELLREPFLLVGDCPETLAAFQAQGAEPQVRMRIHDDYTVLTMVEKGYGVSITAELILRSNRYDVARVPLDPPIKREIGVAFKDMKIMPIAGRYFIDFIRERLSVSYPCKGGVSSKLV